MLAVCGTAVSAQPSKAEKATKSKLHSGPARLLPHKADAEKTPWCPLKQTDLSGINNAVADADADVRAAA